MKFSLQVKIVDVHDEEKCIEFQRDSLPYTGSERSVLCATELDSNSILTEVSTFNMLNRLK